MFFRRAVVYPHIKLTPHGEDQAHQAFMLNNLEGKTQVISSPYKRAIDTANIVHGYLNNVTHAPVAICPMVCERQFGILSSAFDEYPIKYSHELQLYNDYVKAGQEFYAPAPPGGESPIQVATRAVLAINMLSKKYDHCHNLVIVSHSGFIKATLIAYGIMAAEDYCQRIHNGSIHTFTNYMNVKAHEFIIGMGVNL